MDDNEVLAYNRQAWNRQVEHNNPWTIPVGPEVTAAARGGSWNVVLTPTKRVPRSWFPNNLTGVDILCLASGGGQQGPIFAAAGARVTVLDNSPRQLSREREVAERDGLTIETLLGDMASVGIADATFDLVFHPVSNCFAAYVRPVWREAFRVLRAGGVLLAGVNNPAVYMFDEALADERGEFRVRHRQPYSDLTSIDDAERRRLRKHAPLEFGHTLEDQIGGQLEAGFLLTGFYEDGAANDALSTYMPICIATRAVKSPA